MAEALESGGGKIVALRTHDGSRMTADAYVMSLGSYSPLLLKPLGIRIPVYPLKGYSITLALGPDEAPAAPSVSLTDEAHKIVISRLGNAARRGHRRADRVRHERERGPLRGHRAAPASAFPRLRSAPAVDKWAGLRPATPNNVPLIGRTRLGTSI